LLLILMSIAIHVKRVKVISNVAEYYL